MLKDATLLAGFVDHLATDTAVRALIDAGFSTQTLTVVGNGARAAETRCSMGSAIG